MLRKSVTSFGHQRRQSDQRYMIMHLPSYLRRADDVNTRRPIFFVVWADGMRYFATRYSIVVLLTHIYTTTCVGEDVQFFRLPFWRLGRYEPWCRESSTVVCEEERKREPGREIERVKERRRGEGEESGSEGGSEGRSEGGRESTCMHVRARMRVKDGEIERDREKQN